MVFDVALISAVVIYIIATVLLCVFGVNLLAMAIRVLRKGPVQPPEPTRRLTDDELPLVTVQLPVYNELYVARRVIEAVAEFDYPAEKLQIQVLDDSTDETSRIVADAIRDVARSGINIEHIQRVDRVGFKAGALAAGMETATGEYVAIFDADFVPPADYLRRALPYFDEQNDPEQNVAFVQARWGHVNRDYSWLTKLQALAIDGHFLVEQAARGEAGYWFNFNGTAGIWRVEAIADAGGWKADTLTEDLDLSYRAHLRGWRAQFVEDLVVPGEVPAQLTGYRRQQHRWARGSIHCATRLLPQVWRSDERFMVKAQATLHLSAYFIHLLLVLLVLLYPAMVRASEEFGRLSTLFGAGYFLALTSLAPTLFFIVGSHRNGRRWTQDLPRILAITVFGAGMMVNTARAALQMFTHPNPAFERTAKFGLEEESATRSWTNKRYQLAPDKIVFAELALGAYSIWSATIAWNGSNPGIFIFASIFGIGLLTVAFTSILHNVRLRVARNRRERTVRAEQESIEALPVL